MSAWWKFSREPCFSARLDEDNEDQPGPRRGMKDDEDRPRSGRGRNNQILALGVERDVTVTTGPRWGFRNYVGRPGAPGDSPKPPEIVGRPGYLNRVRATAYSNRRYRPHAVICLNRLDFHLPDIGVSSQGIESIGIARLVRKLQRPLDCLKARLLAQRVEERVGL